MLHVARVQAGAKGRAWWRSASLLCCMAGGAGSPALGRAPGGDPQQHWGGHVPEHRECRCRRPLSTAPPPHASSPQVTWDPTPRPSPVPPSVPIPMPGICTLRPLGTSLCSPLCPPLRPLLYGAACLHLSPTCMCVLSCPVVQRFLELLRGLA